LTLDGIVESEIGGAVLAAEAETITTLIHDAI